MTEILLTQTGMLNFSSSHLNMIVCMLLWRFSNNNSINTFGLKKKKKKKKYCTSYTELSYIHFVLIMLNFSCMALLAHTTLE